VDVEDYEYKAKKIIQIPIFMTQPQLLRRALPPALANCPTSIIEQLILFEAEN